MKRRKTIKFIILVLALIVIIWILTQVYQDKKIKQKNSEYSTKNLTSIYNSIENNEKDIVKKEYPKEEIITTYKGYDVLAKLEIPDIKLVTYILKPYSEKSLNKAVAKFWGANPNETGNCCIAGHNAPRNKNMFYNLKKLEIGNVFTISDNTIGKVEYEIYDKYTVEPEDVTLLSQETEGRKEVTLITCTNDSLRRLIIKAREKDS